MIDKIFLIVVLFIALVSCAEDEANVATAPVAEFDIPKDLYEDGEPVEVVNLSRNAVHYEWTFGSFEQTTAENPVFLLKEIPGMGVTTTITLKAIGLDGDFDVTTKKCHISKRIFFDMVITKMTDQFREKIPEHDQQETSLIIYTGKVNEPLEWIEPDQTFPPKKISRAVEVPWRLWIVGWPDFAMDNDTWFLRISCQGKSPADRIMLKEFYFNPLEIEYEPHQLNPETLRKFEVGDDEIAIDILFTHIEH